MRKPEARYLLTLHFIITLLVSSLQSCAVPEIKPSVITNRVGKDADDPAIWIDRKNPANSIILGTDKDTEGSIVVYDLEGRIIEQKCIRGLNRPNNIDVEYGLILAGKPVDIAVVTERGANRIRIYQLPDMTPIDNGGITVFEGESLNSPMGIALYRRQIDGAIYVIVGRKQGPKEGYLWQYRLQDSGNGTIKAKKVRSFGAWSGLKEIEAIAVDDDRAEVYYSDERFGIRKYAADPDAPNAGKELCVFGQTGFTEDHEGIAILTSQIGQILVIVSDQGANALRIYGKNDPEDSNEYAFLGSVPYMARETDGIDLTTEIRTSRFPEGMLVAMSTDRTFHYYSLKELLKNIKQKKE